jgi:hypothetical protein
LSRKIMAEQSSFGTNAVFFNVVGWATRTDCGLGLQPSGTRSKYAPNPLFSRIQTKSDTEPP